MSLFFIFVLIFLLLAILFFSLPSLSPIPYFPSNKKDLPLIIKALNLKNNQAVFDLGAGDGLVIFEAAKEAFRKKLNTKFFAIEINPILILIMWLRWLFHPNKKNIKIIRDDIFKIDPKNYQLEATSYTFYLYLSPWYLKKVIRNLKSRIKKFNLVSYFYPIPKMSINSIIIKGKNKIFVY